MTDNDDRMAVPGMILDAADLDAKLITLRVRGTPHFTGGDLDLIQQHYGKDLSDLTGTEMAVATAYVYLRRAQVAQVDWEMAADQVALEYVQTVDPTVAASSPTSPASADSGDAPPATSTN
ncbi:MAG TPA: hypothetical protein VLL25_14760 [Acidimicrobiales bacterium]|nr:hypothetical protein [Acidimicrobiales bacterium]